MPVLKRNAPTLLSDYVNWSIVSKKRHYLTAKLSPTPTRRHRVVHAAPVEQAAPFASKIGMRVLSDNATPLSTKAT